MSKGLHRAAVLVLAALVFLAPAAVGAESPRLIVIKVDGLSGLVFEAALDPSGLESGLVPYPEQFREAHRWHRDVLGRDILLPNLHAYFVEQGVRSTAMYSSTVTLSAAAWAVIDTGQPSIVKNSFYVNRTSGELQNYLDGLREAWGPLLQNSGRTNSVWQLDLLGVPLLQDAFVPERAWSALQILFRRPSGRQFTSVLASLLTAGQQEAGFRGFARGQLSRFVYEPDFPEINDEALARLAPTLVLEQAGETERFDLLNLFFPALDHQFHVDANYRNILGWLVRIDRWFGEIMSAVERSERRDQTVVALVSDHGHDFSPVAVNYAFPITRWLRDEVLGGHTVLLPHVEDVDRALTVPVAGLDFARVYESAASPYGEAASNGEKGFYTAFTENYGNSRFDAYFRNSDLNELHLMLLDVLHFRSDERRLETIFPFFHEALDAMRPWLERDLAESRSAIRALADYRAALPQDDYARNAAGRLTREIEGYQRQADALARLLAVPQDWDEWVGWARRRYAVSDLIPKGYLGPANRLDQLMNYVVGWEEEAGARWVDDRPALERMDYTRRIPEFRATNPSAYGSHHPFHFFSAGVPVAALDGEWGRPLRQAVWLRFSADRGELLILESVAGELRIVPVASLAAANGRYTAVLDPEGDPLGCPASRTGEPWLAPAAWAARCGLTESSVLPVIVSDLFRPNYETFLESEAFRSRISAQGLDPEAHVAALDYRYRNGLPDFRVWMNRGWNANSREQIPAGTHGGFHPLETRTVFSVWAGDPAALRRGETVADPHFTVDIAPTLFDLIGRLNPDRTVRTDSGFWFPPLPGGVLPMKAPRAD